MMCSATLIFILCLGTITNGFPTKNTRQTSDFERWLWGSFPDQYPTNHQKLIPQTQIFFTLPFNFGAIPEWKFLATSSNSNYEQDLLNVPPKGKRRKNRTKAPCTSNLEVETKPTDPSTISATQPTNESTGPSLTTTKIGSTDLISTSTINTKSTYSPNILSTITDAPSSVSTETISINLTSTSTREDKPSDAPISSTIEPIFIKTPNDTVAEPIFIKTPNDTVAELRLLNSSNSMSPEEDDEKETVTTTEITATEATDVSLETTTADYCDPLPGKPDFSAPGRRLNEAKCMGYVWEMQNRIRKDEQDLQCKRRLFVIHAVGGRKTEVGEFPHMGALGWKATVGTWVFKCGSSLISSNFVLTAAHCTKASPRDSSVADPVPKIVRLGDKKIMDKENIFSFPTDANISRIITHPQYNPPMKYYDIALMELEEPVEFTRLIQPACLWNSFSTGERGHEATLTGWGVIESGSLKNSPELQAATVDVLENDQCDDLLHNSRNRNWKGFQENQLCAGKLAGGVDSCQGDSGGPLQMKMDLSDYDTDRQGQMHYVIGVISFGVGCAHKNLPGIYTRVSSFIDWIEDNVWRDGNERVFVPPPESNFLSFSPGFAISG